MVKKSYFFSLLVAVCLGFFLKEAAVYGMKRLVLYQLNSAFQGKVSLQKIRTEKRTLCLYGVLIEDPFLQAEIPKIEVKLGWKGIRKILLKQPVFTFHRHKSSSHQNSLIHKLVIEKGKYTLKQQGKCLQKGDFSFNGVKKRFLLKPDQERKTQFFWRKDFRGTFLQMQAQKMALHSLHTFFRFFLDSLQTIQKVKGTFSGKVGLFFPVKGSMQFLADAKIDGACIKRLQQEFYADQLSLCYSYAKDHKNQGMIAVQGASFFHEQKPFLVHSDAHLIYYPEQNAHFSLKALAQNTELIVEASLQKSPYREDWFSVKMQFFEEKNLLSSIDAKLCKKPSLWEGKAKLCTLQKSALHTVESTAKMFFPQLNFWHIEKGKVSTKIDFCFDDKMQAPKLQVQDFVCEDFSAKSKQGSELHFAEMQIASCFLTTSDIHKPVIQKLDHWLKKGRVVAQKQTIFPLDYHVQIEKEQIVKGEAGFSFLDLHTKVQLLGSLQKPMIKWKTEGPVQSLAKAFALERYLEKDHTHLCMQLTYTGKEKGNIEGLFSLKGDQGVFYDTRCTALAKSSYSLFSLVFTPFEELLHQGSIEVTHALGSIGKWWIPEAEIEADWDLQAHWDEKSVTFQSQLHHLLLARENVVFQVGKVGSFQKKQQKLAGVYQRKEKVWDFSTPEFAAKMDVEGMQPLALKAKVEKKGPHLQLFLPSLSSKEVFLSGYVEWHQQMQSLLMQGFSMQGSCSTLLYAAQKITGQSFPKMQGQISEAEVTLCRVQNRWHTAKAKAKITDACFPLYQDRTIEKAQAFITLDALNQEFLAQDLKAIMKGKDFSYELYAPKWQWEKTKGTWTLQCYKDGWEKAHFIAEIDKGHEGYRITLSPQSHLCMQKLDLCEVFFDSKGSMQSCRVKQSQPCKKLLEQAEFFCDWGWDTKSFVTLPSSITGEMIVDVATGKENHIFVQVQNCHEPFLGKDFLLQAKKQGSRWNVYRCEYDDLRINCFIDKQKERFHIADLQVNYGSYGKAYGDAFVSKTGRITGDFQQVEGLFSSQDISLLVKGEGGFVADLAASSGISYAVDLDFSCEKLLWQKISWKNQSGLHLHLSDQQGLMIKGIDLEIQEPSLADFAFHCKVDTFFYNHMQQTLYFEDAHFFLPGDVFGFLRTAATKTPLFSSFLGNAWEMISFNQDLEIAGNLTMSLQKKVVEVDLKELFIPIQGKMQHLQDVYACYSPQHLQVEGKWLYQKQQYRLFSLLDFAQKWKSAPWKGAFSIKEDQEASPPLTIDWSLGEKIKIHEVKGECAGIKASLYEDPDLSGLTGSIQCDFASAKILFPQAVQKLIDTLQVGHGFEFRGTIYPDLQNPYKSSLEGIISGKHFEFLGYELQTFLADVSLHSQKLELLNVRCSDPSGRMRMDQMLLYKTAEGLFLKIPQLLIQELRPSLMQQIGLEKPSIDPLLIRQMQLVGLEGNLYELTSFKGKGEMQFINSFKREYTIFDIPSDVLGRIFGLDLELLIPVKGKVAFSVESGKVLLQSLQDTYSENQRSKFFLLDPKKHAYIDFAGNLHIHITMEQYVLFKFTENFVITIEGNVQHPQVRLKRKKSFLSEKAASS